MFNFKTYFYYYNIDDLMLIRFNIIFFFSKVIINFDYNQMEVHYLVQERSTLKSFWIKKYIMLMKIMYF